MIPVEDLGQEIADLATRVDVATHRLLECIRQFDESGEWARQGAGGLPDQGHFNEFAPEGAAQSLGVADVAECTSMICNHVIASKRVNVSGICPISKLNEMGW